MEVSLKDPSEPTLVLLVHSCLAYTEAPYPSGMLVYDGYVYTRRKMTSSQMVLLLLFILLAAPVTISHDQWFGVLGDMDTLHETVVVLASTNFLV